MARKLPWQTKQESTPKKSNNEKTPTKSTDSSTRTASKYFKPVKDEETTPSSTPESLHRSNLNGISTPPTRKRKIEADRTPSSSPPPMVGPPPVSPMRSGYAADDIYIMVEDELQVVAQSFTANLHHAEYKRLRKIARERSPKSLPDPASLAMSVESRSRLMQQAKRMKQDAALKALGALGGKDGDNGDDLDMNENMNGPRAERDSERAAIDPWSGTSLAVLMSPSKRQKMSLMGLEKMPSSTRASLGFGSRVDAAREQRLDLENNSILNDIRDGSDKRNSDRGANDHSLLREAGEHDEDDLNSTHTNNRQPNQSILRDQPKIHGGESAKPSLTSASTATSSIKSSIQDLSHLTTQHKNTSHKDKQTSKLRALPPPRSRRVFDDGFDETLVHEDPKETKKSHRLSNRTDHSNKSNSVTANDAHNRTNSTTPRINAGPAKITKLNGGFTPSPRIKNETEYDFKRDKKETPDRKAKKDRLNEVPMFLY